MTKTSDRIIKTVTITLDLLKIVSEIHPVLVHLQLQIQATTNYLPFSFLAVKTYQLSLLQYGLLIRCKEEFDVFQPKFQPRHLLSTSPQVILI